MSATATSTRPSDERRLRLDQGIIVPTVSSLFPIERYFTAADTLYEKVTTKVAEKGGVLLDPLSHDATRLHPLTPAQVQLRQDYLDETYTYAKRCSMFFTDAIPSHECYGKPQCVATRKKVATQLSQVTTILEVIAQCMDHYELFRRQQAQAKQESAQCDQVRLDQWKQDCEHQKTSSLESNINADCVQESALERRWTDVIIKLGLEGETSFRSYSRKKLHTWKRKLNKTVQSGEAPFTLIQVLQHSARELFLVSRPSSPHHASNSATQELPIVTLFYLDTDGDKNAIVEDRDLDVVLRAQAAADLGFIKVFATVGPSVQTIPPLIAPANVAAEANVMVSQTRTTLLGAERTNAVAALVDSLAMALVSMNVDSIVDNLSKEQLEVALQISDKLQQARKSMPDRSEPNIAGANNDSPSTSATEMGASGIDFNAPMSGTDNNVQSKIREWSTVGQGTNSTLGDVARLTSRFAQSTLSCDDSSDFSLVEPEAPVQRLDGAAVMADSWGGDQADAKWTD